MKGQREKAGRMLSRLGNPASESPLILADIVRTHEEEQQRNEAAKEASFLECFKGVNWRRTRIILYCNALSQVIGSSFMTNGPYFLVQAGMSSAKTGMMTEIGIAFGIASSLITGYVMTVCGRRALVMFGIGLSTTLFTVMGIAGCFPRSSPALWFAIPFASLQVDTNVSIGWSASSSNSPGGSTVPPSAQQWPLQVKCHQCDCAPSH